MWLELTPYTSQTETQPIGSAYRKTKVKGHTKYLVSVPPLLEISGSQIVVCDLSVAPTCPLRYPPPVSFSLFHPPSSHSGTIKFLSFSLAEQFASFSKASVPPDMPTTERFIYPQAYPSLE